MKINTNILKQAENIYTFLNSLMAMLKTSEESTVKKEIYHLVKSILKEIADC